LWGFQKPPGFLSPNDLSPQNSQKFSKSVRIIEITVQPGDDPFVAGQRRTFEIKANRHFTSETVAIEWQCHSHFAVASSGALRFLRKLF
jgi:hypothetical protein